jgi:hypothetical protein
MIEAAKIEIYIGKSNRAEMTLSLVIQLEAK